MDEVFTVLRVVVSLAVVVGVIWFVQRKFVRSSGKRSRRRPVSVVARQNIGGKSSVAVIEFQGRQFLIGVTEHSISVLDSAPVEAESAVETAETGVETAAGIAERALVATVTTPSTVRTIRPIGRRASSKQFAAVLSQVAIEPVPASVAVEAPLPAVASVAIAPAVAPAVTPVARTRVALPDALAASLVKRPEPGAPLAGSLFSGATWKQAFAAIKGER